eukprot:CAMPEP_0203980496 /NCGR_PEP_ID=MMETSP0360-20130528/1488_1 /ASSEMBLY_ACC=CAM_ASM_000342 /TAXON_ID=268821 /ORGANISM="Scrippsiella Hangoei, Strain SHTV-5" /LENGTH=45 /DNA_ID= /DNA_START= /DNA_END= /DNA_ORIENTATION=
MALVVIFALLFGVLAQAALGDLRGSLGNSTTVPHAESHPMSTNTT